MVTSICIEEQPPPLRCFLRTFFLLMMIAALMQFATGCVSLPAYPSQLPSLAANDANSEACPHIAGQYSDKGNAFTSKGKPAGEVSLSQVLHDNDPCFALADSVVVTGPEQFQTAGAATQNVVEVESLKNGQRVARWRSAMGYSISCKKGFAQISSLDTSGGASGYPGGVAAWVYSEAFWLGRAVDGSLIVHSAKADSGIIGIIPYYFEYDLWYRFAPMGQSGPLN